MTIVAITHTTEEIVRFFTDSDLARLRAVAEVRILGGNQRDLVLPHLHDVDVLLGSWGMPRLDHELLNVAPRLKAVCYAAGSVKYFVTPESYARGVTITTVMHANAVPVAEFTVALIPLANKQWFSAQAGMRQARGWHHQPHVGNFETTVGLIGCGAIVRLVLAKLADTDRACWCTIRTPATYRPASNTSPICSTSPVAAMWSACTPPDIPATLGMCNAAFFATMKDGATFINTARPTSRRSRPAGRTPARSHLRPPRRHPS